MLLYLKKFLFCDLGITSIEYALIASLIGVVIFSAVVALGQSVLKLYESIGTNYPK